ncbi:hypothetical protein [Brasilonema sp. UFV-L1]|uniref:hypothetical protein n=1 Tax=Brasilonema sp. UFV-L1 TaxID=2234130 RepID=UPI00145C89DB|nr:hypothetical protein [Brasilonema sp. UFV-L1]
MANTLIMGMKRLGINRMYNTNALFYPQWLCFNRNDFLSFVGLSISIHSLTYAKKLREISLGSPEN